MLLEVLVKICAKQLPQFWVTLDFEDNKMEMLVAYLFRQKLDKKLTSNLSNKTRPLVILFNVIDIVNHINNTQHLVSPDGPTKKF